jgi:hypothetical protein
MIRSNRWWTVALSASLLLAMCVLGCSPSKNDTQTPQIVEKEKGVTLILIENTTDAALSCTLSKGDKKDEDHVRWFNQTQASVPVTITFTVKWPFLEPEQPIVVEAGQFSPYFTVNAKKVGGVDQGAANGPYPYSTSPKLNTGAPDGPTISVGD